MCTKFGEYKIISYPIAQTTLNFGKKTKLFIPDFDPATE